MRTEYVIEYFGTQAEMAMVISDLLARLPKRFYIGRVLAKWEAGGLFAPEWYEQGYKTQPWLRLMANQIAIGIVTAALAAHLEQQLRAEGYSVDAVIEAALVYKTSWRSDKLKTERNLITYGEAFCNRFSTSLNSLPEDAKKLAELMSSKGTGELQIRRRESVPLASEIIYYADCCVDDYKIVGYRRVIDKYDGKSGPDPRPVVMRLGEMLYGDVVSPIEKKLAELIGFQGEPSDLYTLALS